MDTHHPNVVVVVTFAASLRAESEEEWKAKSEEKAAKLRSVVQSTLKVEPQVVFIENETAGLKVRKCFDEMEIIVGYFFFVIFNLVISKK